MHPDVPDVPPGKWWTITQPSTLPSSIALWSRCDGHMLVLSAADSGRHGDAVRSAAPDTATCDALFSHLSIRTSMNVFCNLSPSVDLDWRAGSPTLDHWPLQIRSWPSSLKRSQILMLKWFLLLTSTLRTKCSPPLWHLPPTNRGHDEDITSAIHFTCQLSGCYVWCL